MIELQVAAIITGIVSAAVLFSVLRRLRQARKARDEAKALLLKTEQRVSHETERDEKKWRRAYSRA
ncbi:MAG: hypothetical protein OIF48_10025 [Silicimonas sp.]|nr:hypothetical protein [Silicimonas sp.]